ncbi:hypothetical protein M0R45_031373 [Rubus argutus]|uniref:Uncharacterized protein n=1 Tax=Rubus argutus TaxID=59490 RepID=A0AAW1WE37_RUBAR
MVFIKTMLFLLFLHFVITSCNAVIIGKEATDVCNFTGVSCEDKHRHRHRVTELRLLGHRLVGKLSPIISNLTGLHKLELIGNHFYGTIPPETFLTQTPTLSAAGGDNFLGSIPDSLVLPSN